MVKKKMIASEIVREANMSDMPDFYSGRGAILGDLDDKILEKVYSGVNREYGGEAAKQFVQMVADMPKLSATDFLLTLYRLERNEWRWDRKLLGNEGGLYCTRENFAGAVATGIECMFGSDRRDQTGEIRCDFLRRHKTPPFSLRNRH